MKILELKSFRIVTEGQVEPNALMAIQNVVKRGGASDTFEYIVMARFLELLKTGQLYKSSNPVFDCNLTTSPDLLKVLKAMPKDEQAGVAKRLLDVLMIKDADALYYLVNPTQEYLSWLRLFTTREATD